ncbi:glycogen/starch/alpha-glucan phosphorylase, partial [bacterium]|nr:glycogen/starch/alpha-glucan phosphorylase [bacterium]
MNHQDIYSEIKNLAPQIAYFSMEIGLRVDLPTYSGGLGVLAGDTIKAAADHKLPYVAVTLLYRDGYFQQRLGKDGQQSEKPVKWNPNDLLIELDEITITVAIAFEQVALRPWLYIVEGCDKGQVPVFFLDSDLPENSPKARQLTARLYGGDQ